MCLVAKGIHAALGAQVRIGARLEIVVVTTWRAGGVKVAGRAWAFIAGSTVVELARRALALWAIAVP